MRDKNFPVLFLNQLRSKVKWKLLYGAKTMFVSAPCLQGLSQYETNRGICLSHFFFFGESTFFFNGERKILAANKFTKS